ncbi:MAG TPA: cyclic nucleotide-binding domain-containing protein [Dehalococcoidia bacterium]|nr:cyclic nucleotide-binding domain-containing protein [Dehalococcoidia bacterium]
MTTTIDRLAGVPLFRNLPKKSLERLQRVVATRTFGSGEDIVKEGEIGSGFFLITEGAAEAVRGDTKLATYGPGDFFGEMALLGNHPRSATVRSTAGTTCLALTRWDFVAELRANPDLAVEMLEVMAARLREADKRLAEHD